MATNKIKEQIREAIKLDKTYCYNANGEIIYISEIVDRLAALFDKAYDEAWNDSELYYS